MKPLTIDELKAFDDDFIWLVMNGKGYYVEILHKLYTLEDGDEVGILVGAYEYEEGLNYSDYGTKWLAYKNKEQAEVKGELLELPCEVGDNIYWVCDTNIIEETVKSISVENDGIKVYVFDGGFFFGYRFGTHCFTTQEAAEARLKELQEKAQ